MPSFPLCQPVTHGQYSCYNAQPLESSRVGLRLSPTQFCVKNWFFSVPLIADAVASAENVKHQGRVHCSHLLFEGLCFLGTDATASPYWESQQQTSEQQNAKLPLQVLTISLAVH